MISNRYTLFFSALVAALTLSGCPGSDENSTETGLTLHLAEVHTETTPGLTPLESSGITNSATVQGGYDQTNLEHHVILDGNGHLLTLYRAYVVVDELELVRCTSLSQLPRKLLNGLIPTAEAHTGHGSEPVGGRSLDKPNVIDIVTRDEYILPLGDAAVAPGRYCGVRVALARLAGDGYGKPAYAAASSDDPTTAPEVPDLSGKIFAIRADYCDLVNGANECEHRVKVDFDDTGLTEPLARTIDFDQPLELSANVREGYVALGIAYGQWTQGVDVSLLSSSASERQKFLDNIAASLHIHAKGLGDLPVNVD